MCIRDRVSGFRATGICPANIQILILLLLVCCFLPNDIDAKERDDASNTTQHTTAVSKIVCSRTRLDKH